MLKIVGKFFSKALYITAYVCYGSAALYGVYVVGTWIFDKEAPLEFYSAVYGSEVLEKGSKVSVSLELRQHKICPMTASVTLSGDCGGVQVPVNLGDLEDNVADTRYNNLAFTIPSNLHGICPVELTFTYNCNPFHYFVPLKSSFSLPPITIQAK